MRVLAGVLWFWVGWLIGSYLTFYFGVSAALGPLLGAILGGLIGGDPFHLIWWPRTDGQASDGITKST